MKVKVLTKGHYEYGPLGAVFVQKSPATGYCVTLNVFYMRIFVYNEAACLLFNLRSVSFSF